MQESRLLQELAQRTGLMRAELFAVAQGQLERGALQMPEHDFEIIRIDIGVLWRPFEEVVRMLDNVLIERRARRNQHPSRGGLPASSTAPALPLRGDPPPIHPHPH